MRRLFFSDYLLAVLILCSHSICAQKNKSRPLDSTLEANSEKWKVKLHKGFGRAKPEFGPYATTEIKKLDSPVFRKRTKEGSYSGAIISSASWDWEFSKYKMFEKKTAFSMMVAKDADTSEMLFSIYSVSHSKELSFFGEIMNKNEEGKNATLSYKNNISGLLAPGLDSTRWRFFMEDTFSRNEGSSSFAGPSTFTRSYIITGSDSLFTEPIINHLGKPGSKYSWEWQEGVFVRNAKGERIAALKFGAAGDLSNPFYVWIRKDLDPTYQHAIASLFALLMMVKTT